MLCVLETADVIFCRRRQDALDEVKGEIAKATGARVRAPAADVADLVVFVLFDRSSYITGQAIDVTGGEVVW